MGELSHPIIATYMMSKKMRSYENYVWSNMCCLRILLNLSLFSEPDKSFLGTSKSRIKERKTIGEK